MVFNATPGFGADPDVINARMREANDRNSKMKLVHSDSSHNSDDDKELAFGYFKSNQPEFRRIDTHKPKSKFNNVDDVYDKNRSPVSPYGADSSFSPRLMRANTALNPVRNNLLLPKRSPAAAPVFADKSSIGTDNSDDEKESSGGRSCRSIHAIAGRPYRPKPL
jgi:hypothetical protein